MSDPHFLIMSGSYVGPELVSEFGQLPPCFLPNGTQRLFEEQISFARTLSSNTAILLPDGFESEHFDEDRFRTNSVRVLRSRDSMSTSEGLAAALADLDHGGRLFMLFGDTLVNYDGRASEPDTFASGSTQHLAKWADYHQDGDRTTFYESVQADGATREVVAGFFDFADARLLRTLSESHSDFISLLNAYAAARSLRPVPAVRWLDFGHLHTYYWSRRTELASRDFNQVVGDGLTIRKTGTPARKIYAEAAWFQNLPVRLRPFVPHFIDLYQEPEITYELEYLHLPVLSELYCFARLPSQVWANIVNSCREFLTLCHTVRPQVYESPAKYPERFFDDIFVGKTFQRLESFSIATSLSLDEPWTFNGIPTPSLSEIAREMIGLIAPSSPDDICFWHGDFHFANIFFDFRSQRIRVVDPRGMLSDGTVTVYGDARYDISKLTHSVVGMYDYLMADRYVLAYDGAYDLELNFQVDPEREKFISEYMSFRIGRYECANAERIAMVALLFLSMLPLHGDNRRRQFALLGNGLRLALMARELA